MIRWLLVAGYILALFVFSAQPESSAGTMNRTLLNWFPHLSRADVQAIVFYLRKTGHVIAYFLATILLFYAAKITKGLKKLPYLSAFILTTLLASADEYYQSTLPHRSGKVSDVFIDMIGMVGALGIVWIVEKSRKKRSSVEVEKQDRREHDVEN